MKYKVGDIVKISSNLKPGTLYCMDDSKDYKYRVMDDMLKYTDKFAVIKRVFSDCYRIDLDNKYWMWTDEMFVGEYNYLTDFIPTDMLDLVSMGVYTVSDVLNRMSFSSNFFIKEPLKKAEVKKEESKKENKENKMKTNFKIVNYKVCDNNGVKTIVVEFGDGTKEHAVCCPEDTFELSRGIEVCVMKYIFGRDNYKATLKNAMKQIKELDKAKETAEKERKMVEAKKATAARKKARYKANKAAKRVAEMKEAYLAAMKEYDKKIDTKDINNNCVKNDKPTLSEVIGIMSGIYNMADTYKEELEKIKEFDAALEKMKDVVTKTAEELKSEDDLK